ncbi:MAG: protein kinase [Bryobacteraceae bacterium]
MATPPSRVGPYEILSRLGKGGMGEVWKAHDPRLGRDVAVKISAQQFTDRFEREARAIAALNHSNICTLYDVGPNYLVMELVEGPTLAEHIAQGPIPLEEALGIAKQIADALEAAHEKGIVHRDLKPANIKIKPDGQVKVLDFGLAKSAEQTPLTPDSPTMLTVAGMILGTAGYMSPEQARAKDVDKRADIWAFGVVLYEMLTGQRLFEGETVGDTLAAVIKEEPDLTKVPAKVQRLLRRCLEKDPKKRLRDITGAEFLLEAVEPAAITHRKLPWIAAAAIFAVLASALAFVHLGEKPPETPVVRAFIPPPDKTAFNIRGALASASPPALSPDGRRLVFSALDADGKNQLWVRALDALTSQPLAGTDGATHPFWSPDSKLVGFFAAGKLKKIDASGGTAITLCDAVGGRGGTWSQNGAIVFATDRLYQVSAAGGVPAALTPLVAGTDPNANNRNYFNPRWPSFLPDGRHFLYLAANGGQTGGSIRVGALDSKEEGKIVADALSNAVYAQGHLLYLRENTLVAQPFDLKRLATAGEAIPVAESVQGIGAGRRGVFSVSGNGLLIYVPQGTENRFKLAWLDRGGKPIGTLDDVDGFFTLNFSPDRKSLAASIMAPSNRNEDIWLYDVSRALRTRFTFDPALETDPVWSSDGRSIFFSSNRKGRGNLYRKSADGSGVEELLYEDKLNKRPNAVSPDGKYLVYEATRDLDSTLLDLWVLPLEGERKPFPFVQTTFSEREAQFSPDGRWIAYASNESGRAEIYAAPFSGTSGAAGGKRQISTSGGQQPRWRRDGKEIFYVEPGGRLMAAEVSVKGASLDAGTVSPLFGPIRTGGGFQYDVSADGQRFLAIVQPEQNAGEPLTLVQNWTALLKK